MNELKRSFPINDYFLHALTVVVDQEWKSMRNVITPTFSAAKLKALTPTINECAQMLGQHMGESVDRGDRVIELKK